MAKEIKTKKTKKNIGKEKIDLFDAAGQLNPNLVNFSAETEKLFEIEADRKSKLSLNLKPEDASSKKEVFIENLKELTIVNLAEIILSPLFFIFKKLRANYNNEAKNLADPFSEKKTRPRGLAGFIIFCLLFILPLNLFFYYENITNIKSSIEFQSNEAILALKNGQNLITTLNLSQAADNFNQAKNNFQQIIDEFNNLDLLTKNLININPSRKIATEASLTLIDAGKNLAEIGQIVADSGNDILNNSGLLYDGWQEKIIYRLAKMDEALSLTLPKIAAAKTKLSEINLSDIPAEYRDKIKQAQNALPTLESSLIGVAEINEALLTAIGHYQWQRYLLIFENNNEMRATGGFMGSFAIVDIDRGKIKNIEIPGGGTYDLQGSLTALLSSPEPLHLINPTWELQDSNWWPDFPTSAKKIAWFLEHSQGPSVDGVIALTPSVIEKMLEITGPIQMPEYDRVITAQNLVAETQKIVELEYDKTANRPKQFIADLTPLLLEKIFNLGQDEMPKILQILADSLAEKNLLIYSKSENIQTILASLNWSGEFKPEQNSDYLAVINTNIGGGKTDNAINQNITHQIGINADGKIFDTLTIDRIHTGSKDDLFTGVQNNDYIRIYVPRGSRLISASGFDELAANLFAPAPSLYKTDSYLSEIETDKIKDSETNTDIYNENNLTVFGNWITVKPGEQKTITLKYELPFVFNNKNFKIKVQKQAGANNVRYGLILNNSTAQKIISINPNNNFQAAINVNNASFTDILNTDKYFEVNFD